MKPGQIVGITLLSGLVGIILAQLLLPIFIITIEPSLDQLSLADMTNILSWAAILMTFAGLFITIIVFSARYKFGAMMFALLWTTVISIIVLCLGSFWYLALYNPEMFQTTNFLVKILKFGTYPTLVTLTLGDPQPIWIISTVLFITIFNLIFLGLVKNEK
ncbi:hypothetical protein [Candidatus Harpocratesius sp.]